MEPFENEIQELLRVVLFVARKLRGELVDAALEVPGTHVPTLSGPKLLEDVAELQGQLPLSMGGLPFRCISDVLRREEILAH